MRRYSITWAVVVLGSACLLCSCSSLRAGAPVKAKFEGSMQQSVKEKSENENKSFFSFLPPPNEARKQWDSYQKRKTDHWNDETGHQAP